MATVDEIHDAQQAVVKAALGLPACHDPDLRTACENLRALQSPLPSRDDMHAKARAVDGWGATPGEKAESHWSECLMWFSEYVGGTTLGELRVASDDDGDEECTDMHRGIGVCRRLAAQLSKQLVARS